MNNEELINRITSLEKEVSMLKRQAIAPNMDAETIRLIFNFAGSEQKVQIRKLLNAVGYIYP